MDVFESRYYKVNKFFLSIVGLWPYMNARTKRIRTSFVNFILVIIILAQLLKLLTTKLNVNLLITILSNSIVCLCIQVVYAAACACRTEVGYLIDHVKMDWLQIESGEENIIFKKYAKETRIYTIVVIIALYGTIYCLFFLMLWPLILDIIVPLDEPRPRDIIFPMELFFNPNEYFHIAFPMVFVSLNIMCGASTAVYTLIFVLLQHTNGLFDLVGYIFETAIEDDDPRISMDPEEEKKIYCRLVRGIWFHKRTIKFVAEINSICEMFYLIEVSLLIIVIGVDILRLLQVPLIMENAQEIITCILHIEGNLLWLFINCYFGQKILDNSSKVHIKVYNAKWHSSSLKIKKLIVTILARSMKPSHLSIGRLFVSSMEFFLSLLQTSISYAMVFYSLQH